MEKQAILEERVRSAWVKHADDFYWERHGLHYIKHRAGEGWIVWRIVAVTWMTSLAYPVPHQINGHQAVKVAGPFVNLDEAQEALDGA